MDEAKQALIELENKVRELEARIKKLENWKLVHTSMSEEEQNQKILLPDSKAQVHGHDDSSTAG